MATSSFKTFSEMKAKENIGEFSTFAEYNKTIYLCRYMYHDKLSYLISSRYNIDNIEFLQGSYYMKVQTQSGQ